jgi:hypothetical protein
VDRWADNEGFQDIQHREIMKELYVIGAYQGACPLIESRRAEYIICFPSTAMDPS